MRVSISSVKTYDNTLDLKYYKMLTRFTFQEYKVCHYGEDTVFFVTEINSLDDLIYIKQTVGHELIFRTSYWGDAVCDYDILIYDGYME